MADPVTPEEARELILEAVGTRIDDLHDRDEVEESKRLKEAHELFERLHPVFGLVRFKSLDHDELRCAECGQGIYYGTDAVLVIRSPGSTDAAGNDISGYADVEHADCPN